MKVILLIVAFITYAVIWSLPLYICANFVLWLFHIEFHLTILQSFGLGILINVIYLMIFKPRKG